MSLPDRTDDRIDDRTTDRASVTPPVRPLAWRDVPAAHALLTQTFATVKPHALRRVLCDERQLTGVVHRPDAQGQLRLVGLVALVLSGQRHSGWLAPGWALIDMVAVHPGWRGQRLAETLMAWAEDQARAAGQHRIGLTAHGDNLPAQALYRRLGYALVPITATATEAHTGTGTAASAGQRWVRTLHAAAMQPGRAAAPAGPLTRLHHLARLARLLPRRLLYHWMV
jgi:ribosomal protein S18 acetylase RimI-like enzyme